MLQDWTLPIIAALMLVGAAALVAAAAHDIVARTVPDWISVFLTSIGVLVRAMDQNLIIGLLVAVAVFCAVAFCWRRGWVGGGDVILIGATALIVPPASVLSFIAAMSIAGSVLALLYLAAGPLARSGQRTKKSFDVRYDDMLSRIVRVELWRIRRGGSLPYACAIAAGFLFTIIT